MGAWDLLALVHGRLRACSAGAAGSCRDLPARVTGRGSRGLGAEGPHPADRRLSGEGDGGQEGCGGWGQGERLPGVCLRACGWGRQATGDGMSCACLRMRLRRGCHVASCEFGCVWSMVGRELSCDIREAWLLTGTKLLAEQTLWDLTVFFQMQTSQ